MSCENRQRNKAFVAYHLPHLKKNQLFFAVDEQSIPHKPAIHDIKPFIKIFAKESSCQRLFWNYILPDHCPQCSNRVRAKGLKFFLN